VKGVVEEGLVEGVVNDPSGGLNTPEFPAFYPAEGFDISEDHPK
jgi:hypothetical protein